MINRIIAESHKYFVLNCKDTIYEGNYQLLEKSIECPNERTIGVYSNKKDAMQAFNLIIKTPTL
jgi:hypothetical protein